MPLNIYKQDNFVLSFLLQKVNFVQSKKKKIGCIWCVHS